MTRIEDNASLENVKSTVDMLLVVIPRVEALQKYRADKGNHMRNDKTREKLQHGLMSVRCNPKLLCGKTYTLSGQ